MNTEANVRQALITLARGLPGAVPWRHMGEAQAKAEGARILALWAEQLADVEPVVIMQAVSDYLKTGRYWPTIAEIRRLALRQRARRDDIVLDELEVSDEPAVQHAYRLPHPAQLRFVEQYSAGPPEETSAEMFERLNCWVREQLTIYADELLPRRGR